jgi:hypothetical protein
MEKQYQIRDPFVGEITIVGETITEAIMFAYEDIPAIERPAYVWYQGVQMPVPGGTCTPVQ